MGMCDLNLATLGFPSKADYLAHYQAHAAYRDTMRQGAAK